MTATIGEQPGRRTRDAAYAHELRVARHADQETLVRHLAETTRRYLAGEDHGARIVGRQPQEIVVLGVLPPRPPEVDAPPPPPVGDLPVEPGVPVDLLPPSEMGLSCLVAPNEPTLQVTAEVRFALYLRHFPTYEEQALFSRAGVHAAVDSSDDNGLGSAGDQAGQARSGAAAGAAGGAHGGRRRPSPTDELQLVYERYDITAPVTITVDVPEQNDSAPHTVSVSLAHAVTTAVFGERREPAEAQPGGRFQLLDRRGQRIPHDVLTHGADAYADYLAEQASRDWVLPVADVLFDVTVQRSLDGRLRVDLTLVNASMRGDRENGFVPELAVYDAGFDARLTGGPLANMGYSVIDHDYRVDPVVYAHGRFCCPDDRADARRGELATTTWPLYRQAVYESRADLQPTFQELRDDPVPALTRIADAMREFEARWRQYLSDDCPLGDVARQRCTQDLEHFVDEVSRFEHGIRLVDTNAWGLGEALKLMNEAFGLYRAAGPLDPDIDIEGGQGTWRLFQIVFVVANLPALAAREADDGAAVLEELAFADVLWFPTGGGKSDAIYGLAATAMFYDRLRGKEAGVSALVRFPLRMLSVQQLDRTLRLIVACERVRNRHELSGDDFKLGYFVGRQNTPNRLTDGGDPIWHDIVAMSSRPNDWLSDHVIITVCPYCGSSEITLEPEVATVRLWHRCCNCDRRLPVVVSDDEVYRYLPAIVIATVDKLATVAFNPHFSHLTHGPRYRCPDHGFVTFPSGRDQRCIARGACTRNRAEWEDVDVHDPAPALLVQDELHLLNEELGTFSAHYETLFQTLCVRGSGRPPKILAATATISDYENQARQLYALKPRRFPSEGFIDGQTFYAERHDDLARRLFIGVLPNQVDSTTLAQRAGERIRAELERLRHLDPAAVITNLGLTATGHDEVAELLFAYELQLAYANKKTDADRFYDRMAREGATGDPAYFQAVRLNGQTPLAEISAAIRRVERETLDTPAAQRLAAIAGTSLVSHGVDLERLNVEFILGLPPTIAYYVQATSRAGRSQVGLVVCSLGRNYSRDRSVYHFFEPTHEYVNQLVEPVALNRFSVHGPKKTASGLLAGLLLCDWGRNLVRLAPAYTTETNFGFADDVRNWLSRSPATLDDDLRADLRIAFGLHSDVLDPLVADRFGDEIDRLFNVLIASIRGSNEQLLSRALRPAPPRSFRDIDASVTFGTTGPYSRQKFALLSRYDDAPEVDVADEADTP